MRRARIIQMSLVFAWVLAWQASAQESPVDARATGFTEKIKEYNCGSFSSRDLMRLDGRQLGPPLPLTFERPGGQGHVIIKDAKIIGNSYDWCGTVSTRYFSFHLRSDLLVHPGPSPAPTQTFPRKQTDTLEPIAQPHVDPIPASMEWTVTAKLRVRWPSPQLSPQAVEAAQTAASIASPATSPPQVAARVPGGARTPAVAQTPATSRPAASAQARRVPPGEFGDVKGESEDKKHQGTIDVIARDAEPSARLEICVFDVEAHWMIPPDPEHGRDLPAWFDSRELKSILQRHFSAYNIHNAGWQMGPEGKEVWVNLRPAFCLDITDDFPEKLPDLSR
jgi:hypothetical protein